jgi:peptidoglycan/LPS O-acetylase OafA/YrhL
MSNHRFVLLDGLRGLAAIGVVLTHVASRQFPFLSGLYLLVDFFFVLSGFVLEPLMPKPDAPLGPQVRRFIYKRFLRFWPMVLVVLASRVGTCASWSYLDKPATRFCGAMSSSDYSLSLISAALLLQVVVPSSLIFSGPLWSLSAEWLTNVAVAPFTAMKHRLVLPMFVVLGYGLLAVGYLQSTSSDDLFVGFAAVGRAIVGFVIGLLLRQLFTLRASLPSVPTLVLSAFLVIGLFVYQRTPYPGALLLAAPVFAFFVYQVACINQGNVQRWIMKLSGYLGVISFGVYAWHGDMRFLVATFQSDEALKPYATHSTSTVVLVTLAVLILSIIATHLTIKFVEAPIQKRWGKRSISSPHVVDSV